MAEVVGIDHIYITVSDLAASENFYDRVMVEALGFRKNYMAIAFTLACRRCGPRMSNLGT